MNDTRISVSRRIDAPASEIFTFLTLPANHKAIDDSGFIRSVKHGDRIQATGEVFSMEMEGDHMGGEYVTENHVSAYSPNQLVGWKTAPEGKEPPGWEWVWELTPDGPDATDVTLTYDWGKVTDKELLAKNLFPLLSKDQLEQSLANLASAVA